MDHFSSQLSLRKKKDYSPITMTDLLETRQNFKLSLRKSRLDKLLSSKRFNSVQNTQTLSSLVDSIPSINNNKELLYQIIDNICKIFLKLNGNPNDVYSKEVTEQLLLKIISFITNEIVHYLNEIQMIKIILECLFAISNYLKNTDEKISYLDLFFCPKQNLYTYLEIYKQYSPNEKAFTNLILYFIANVIAVSKESQLLVYQSGLFGEIASSINLSQDPIEDIDVKIFFLSQLSVSSIYENDIMFSLQLQKIYFDIILLREELLLRDEHRDITYILNNSLWGLANVSFCENDTFINNFIKFDIISYIINSNSKSQVVLNPSLKIIGNLLSNKEEFVNKIISPELFHYLIENICYKNNDISIKSIGLWAMSNIFSDENQQKYIFQYNLPDILNDLFELNFPPDSEIDKEIAFQIGKYIEISNDEAVVVLIKKYDICSLQKKMLEKYSYNLRNMCHIYKCHLIMTSLIGIVSKNGEGGKLAVEIFNKNGITDLIERVILQCSNPIDNEYMKKKVEEIEKMGEIILDEYLSSDTRTISNDDNEDI